MQKITNKTSKTNKPNQTALAGLASEQQNHLQTTITQAATAARRLHRFINPSELESIGEACRGEEREFFRAKLVELAEIVCTMPTTYKTDGQGDAAIVYLHYFTLGGDFYITERDHLEDQLQAFGMVSGIYEDELGYINLSELIACGAELDLYWEPKTLGQIKAERQMAGVNYTGHPMHY
jgi:hypothetical protein